MRFSLNVHTLFTEVPLLERFELAAEAGFGAVESWWPVGAALDAYAAAVRSSGLELVLLNFDGGDPATGDRGLLACPERSDAFRANVPVALELAESLGCRRLNAPIGLELPGRRAEQLQLAVENVRWAADLARRQDAQVLIEPINRFDNGPYLLDRLDDAVAFIDDVGLPNVRLQFDVYHARRTEGGDVSALLARRADRVAHVQVADFPGRGYPGSGEVDFPRILLALERSGYDGYVGLEYRPEGSTPAALEWLPRALRRGDHSVEQLLPYIG